MVITHRDLVEHLEPLKPDLPNIPPGNYVLTDSADTPGYRFYHHLTAQASDGEPVDEDGKPIINRFSAHLALNISELPPACGIRCRKPSAFPAASGPSVAAGSAPW